MPKACDLVNVHVFVARVQLPSKKIALQNGPFCAIGTKLTTHLKGHTPTNRKRMDLLRQGLLLGRSNSCGVKGKILFVPVTVCDVKVKLPDRALMHTAEDSFTFGPYIHPSPLRK